MYEAQDNCRVDPSKYVVLDVETNGLSSVRDDLLSLSIYKPDTGETYNRFLPLEKNAYVYTTSINGIKTDDLQGLLPLSQDEVDEIIRVFELKERIILTYGNIDEKFITKYFQQHHLRGLDYFAFYNFKHEIISSRFSEGNISKDNLCKIYGIENVQGIHSGYSDCILEWKLFERMNGHRLLVKNNNVFEFNDEYIVPVSFISTFPNLKYYLRDLPSITCESQTVFSLTVSFNEIKAFPRNFNGLIIEHLINSMLNVRTIDSKQALIENKKKLKYLGQLPSIIDEVPLVLNKDGSMSAIRSQDKELVDEINVVISALKKEIVPLIEFIGNDIFNGQTIKSQELVIHPEKKVLALCDLSNDYAVLEIKASAYSPQRYAEQLFFEANGRKCYILLVNIDPISKTVNCNIHEVFFSTKQSSGLNCVRYEDAKRIIETKQIELLSYINATYPIRLKCKFCGHEWNSSYTLAKKHRPCPNCVSKRRFEEQKNEEKKFNRKKEASIEKSLEKNLSKEELRKYRINMRYKSKIERRSNKRITIASYENSKTPVKAICLTCGFEWETKYNKLLDQPYCPACKKL